MTTTAVATPDEPAKTPAPPWVDLLAKVLRDGPPSLPNRLCNTDTATMFDGDNPADVDDAVATCNRCSHIVECREWSRKQKPKALSGVVAGELREWVEHPSRRPRVHQEATHA